MSDCDAAEYSVSHVWKSVCCMLTKIIEHLLPVLYFTFKHSLHFTFTH